MKKFSKLLSILLCLSMVLSFLPTIASADTTVTYDFTKVTTVSSSSYNATTIKTVLDSCASDTTALTSVTACNTVYPGNQSGGPTQGSKFLKFSSSNANGTLTMVFNQPVSKVEIVAWAWKSGEGKVSVNGSATQDASTTAFGVLTFDLATATDTVAISITKRALVQSITVTFGEADPNACTHENSTYITSMAGHQQDCSDCDYVGSVQAHTFSEKKCTVCDYELYTPAHLDKVILHHPSSGTTMSATNSNGKLAAGEAVELVVVVDADGHYSFVDAEGRYLTSGATGSSLSFANAASEYSLWDLEEAESGWNLKNTNAAYVNGSTTKPQYLEYYNNTYTTYSLSSGDAFAFQFEKKGTATDIPQFQCPHTENISDTALICKECREIFITANSTQTEILDTAFALNAGEAFPINVTLTGTISKVVYAYSTDYENITVNMVIGDKTIQAYRMKGTGADLIGVGDTITVTGIIKNHNGTVEFDANCTLDSYTLHTCTDTDPADHDCDLCGKELTKCADENKDHNCDICNTPLTDCVDTDTDHACDNGCNEVFGTCEDTDKDHACDYGCDEVFGTCEDKDKDHACDYGCDKVFGTCEDKDKDHACDYGCAKTYGEHVDTGNDHVCDYGCSESIGDHVDANNDHSCDYGCSENIGEHADGDDKDHACDHGCGAILSECVDTDPADHKCDICEVNLSVCKDDDEDHICDICGTELCEGNDHIDENNDHICDACNATASTCADGDKNHKCDICDKELSKCADTDKNHKCDLCGAELSKCDDTDKNHKCDLCGAELSKCDDADKNHKCDLCGKVLSECAWDEGKVTTEPTTEAEGVKTYTCTICGATKTEKIEKLPATEPDDGKDEPTTPADDELTVEEAITMGEAMEHNTYTEDKYYVTGVITEVYNTQYGNMKITDEDGNILTVYGTWSADGETRYDALEVKPVVGDTVTVYGIVGQYNGTAQIKNGWITEHTPGETEPDEPTVEPDEPTVEPDEPTVEPEKPNKTETVTGDTIADGTYIISFGDLTLGALEESYNYGYPKAGSLAAFTGNDLVTVKNVDGGFTIQDCYGRYIYMKDSYNSFNVSTEAPEAGHVWSIVADGNNYKIVNVMNNKTLAYSTQYTSWGAYSELTEDHNSVITLTAVYDTPADTGDTTISVVFGLLLASAMGTAIVITKKKEF